MTRGCLRCQLTTGTLCCVLTVTVLAGCGGGKRARIEPPRIDADAVGKAALAAYDTNKDGVLSEEELAKCPALHKARALYDKNKDGKIDATEIADRVRRWQATRTGLMPVGCSVMLDGNPLEDACVELVPEVFLADSLPNASGTTNRLGMATLSVDRSSLPASQRELVGVRCGLYQIRVTHPSQKIPATYNSETTLGQEVAVDNIEAVHLQLKLKSR